MKVCLPETELSMLLQMEVSLDGAMIAVNKKLSEAGMKCSTLRWIRDVVLVKLRTLETDFGESLDVLSKQITEGTLILSKQHKIEVAQGLEIFWCI